MGNLVLGMPELRIANSSDGGQVEIFYLAQEFIFSLCDPGWQFFHSIQPAVIVYKYEWVPGQAAGCLFHAGGVFRPILEGMVPREIVEVRITGLYDEGGRSCDHWLIIAGCGWATSPFAVPGCTYARYFWPIPVMPGEVYTLID
jgi:hypothetical protein